MLYLRPRSRDPKGQPMHGQFRRTQRAIDKAFFWLQIDQDDAELAHARKEVLLCRAGEMSQHQSLDVKYVLGRSDIAIGRYDEGMDFLTQAFGLATELHEDEAAIQIAHCMGIACRCVSRFAEAVSYHRWCVGLLQGIPQGKSREYLDLEVRALAELAMFSDWCGYRDAARAWLQQAEQAARTLGPFHPRQGPIAWSHARFLRDEGRLIEALKHAEHACEFYAQVGNPIAYVRILTLAADIALDIADSLPPHWSEREHYIEIARMYFEPSGPLVSQHNDQSGLGLATLVDARLQRASGNPEDRVSQIKLVEAIARHRNDVVLLIQAHTAMGVELEHQQSHGPARNMYVKALDLARGPDLSTLATAPALGLSRIDGLL